MALQPFDKIKTKIHNFTRSSIIESSIELLSIVEKEQKKNFPIWFVLVLVKWAFVYTKNTKFKKRATIHDIINILRLIEEFESRRVIDFKFGIRRGLRILAYQQSLITENIHTDVFERQLALYTQRKSRFDIESDFQKRTNLTIVDFIKMSQYTFIYLNMDKFNTWIYDGVLHQDYWDIMNKQFGHTKTKSFETILAFKGESDILKLQKMTQEVYQLYETNLWTLKPFFFFRGNYRILHRTVFNLTVRDFIYDFMKRVAPEEFGREFGHRMERYVEFGLEESGKSFKNEQELRLDFPGSGKIVDFLTEENLLIECKAIELHPRAGIIRKKELLLNEFQDSIIKSYQQLLSAAQSIKCSIPAYGLVVTYKDTYVGFGSDAWSEFLERPILEFLKSSNIPLSVLPPENLCFITIQDWDHMVQVVKEKPLSFKDIMHMAFSSFRSKIPDEQIMFFDQELKKQFPISTTNLSYLQNARTLLNN
ncbi:MAG TPA: hypothetical protein PLV21_04990 [Cyclobacteriaceae bacterium]|nr:hypothetical protein [Cyclobacteriaceae bacterium]HRJ81215.1 hypothetical protein [Cyclobacteriaceae bacterium]